jgi:hypothetical protein
MTKAEFLKDVEHEVEMLKEHATNIELNKLDIAWLDPRKKSACIYGQMTGDCRNARAVDLIMICCKRVVKNDRWNSGGIFETAIVPNINGAPTAEHLGQDLNYYSTIESYIMLEDAKNEHIIQYLKGEVKTLVL